MSKVYRGVRNGRECVITVNGEPLPPPPACGEKPFYDWGFGGTGPANTALAILTDCVGAQRAEELHQQFKRAVVAEFHEDGFVLTEGDIQRWLELATMGFMA